MTDNAVYRSPGEGESAHDDPDTHAEGSTFPAGTALVGFFLWFILARALANVTAQRERMLEIATFAGVFGAVLASLALVGSLVRAAIANHGASRWLHAIRAVGALPVALLVFGALFGEPKLALQWAGLVGAVVTLWTSAVVAMARPGAFRSARVTFALLVIGESIELAYAPAQALLPVASSAGVTMAWLGRVAELATIAGAISASVWAYRASERAVGAQRTRLFLPFPAALGAMLLALVVVIPANAAAILGRTAFGARFDLVTSDSVTSVHRVALLGYLIAPTLLLGAAALSLASVGYDNGAGSRRASGWLLILFAGFGVLRLAGPMDPIRLVMVALAMVLLERSSDREKLL
ncbi:MAG: hypothetical protein JNK05_29415 [Myxococcales bacterium]|nr:hypothetical protein [Myxococcales bacterium]